MSVLDGIPLEVIARGRGLEEVLDLYMQYEKDAEKVSTAKTTAERFADGCDVSAVSAGRGGWYVWEVSIWTWKKQD